MARNLVASNDINITTSGDDISLSLTNSIKNTIKESAISNEESESTTVAYSCDYTNDRNTYSTSETFTGKYWIDGKPIYRKVFNRGTSLESFSHGISNVSDIWVDNTYSVRIHASGNYLALNGSSDSSSNKTSCYVNQTTVTINNFAGVSPVQVYVCLEYTKTTD